jgi:carbonic anhydrase/acetyltransferase-like protein (isoleucine patch superfamily)
MQKQLPGYALTVDASVFIAPTAVVVGNVSIGAHASVWFGSVVRGDGEPIAIGDETNIQDLCLLHTDPGYPLVIGDRCTLGHRVTAHGCRIGNDVLIGMSATILTGAVVEDRSIVAAGSLLTERKHFPGGVLIMGAPARVIRDLTDDELSSIGTACRVYVTRGADYKRAGFAE